MEARNVAAVAEWSKAVVLSLRIRYKRSAFRLHKHHYREMRGFEPHRQQFFLLLPLPSTPVQKMEAIGCHLSSLECFLVSSGN